MANPATEVVDAITKLLDNPGVNLSSNEKKDLRVAAGIAIECEDEVVTPPPRGGPFQPPAQNELRDVQPELERVKWDRDNLLANVKRQNALLDVKYVPELEHLLSYVLGNISDDASVGVQANDDGLVITVEGLRVDDDGEFNPLEVEFEV